MTNSVDVSKTTLLYIVDTTSSKNTVCRSSGLPRPEAIPPKRGRTGWGEARWVKPVGFLMHRPMILDFSLLNPSKASLSLDPTHPLP
jgi:hypothetical protein